ncbi:tail fiber assembly protein [Enterobacter bugandensis]|nr:tail fiber assembly protein [Enterobacter bugandensis]
MIFFDTVRYENILIEVDDIQPFMAGAAINAADETWYDFQKTITTKYACLVNAESGRVRYASEDASKISPGVGERAFGVDTLPLDFFDFDFSYWQFDGEQFIPWQLTQEELSAAATMKKTRLIARAGQFITPLQDAFDTGSSTYEQDELLLNWKSYRLAVSKIDTGQAPDITWPEPPQI